MKKSTGFISMAVGNKDSNEIFRNLQSKIGGAIARKVGVVEIDPVEGIDSIKQAQELLSKKDSRIDGTSVGAIELRGLQLQAFKRVNQINRNVRAFVFFGR